MAVSRLRAIGDSTPPWGGEFLRIDVNCSSAYARAWARHSITWHVIAGPPPVHKYLSTIHPPSPLRSNMQSFPLHTLESAPGQSRQSLQTLQGAFGTIPNIAGVMSTSAVLINSLVALFQKVHGGSFSEEQIQVLLLTNAVTNSCPWAVAFHSALALQEGVAPADVQAIRRHQTPTDPKNAALSTLARTLIERRGRLDDLEVSRFLQAGFEKAHLLEVIAVVAASTITNYTGNVARPPVEATLEEHVWSST
jgi:alkylhydroperoxidase family enzyme